MSIAVPIEGSALVAHPITSALFAATREDGYGAVAIDRLLCAAGMSRAEFDASFEGKTDLTVKVFEATIDDFKQRTGRVFASIPSWPDNLRATAYETVRWIRANPEAIWFGMSGVLEAPDSVLLVREEALKWTARMIDAGREFSPDPEAVPRAAPFMAVGAIAETVRRQQEGSIEDDLLAAVPKIMSAAVRPYLGEAAALRELSVPPPVDLG